MSTRPKIGRYGFTFTVMLAVWIGFCAAGRGEEGGAGHYTPGATASFMDALPSQPGLALANYFMYYEGSTTHLLPFGNQVTLDAHSRVSADTILALYETPLKLLGGNYTAGIAIPYVWLELDGRVTGSLGNTASVRDTADGVGDITLYPAMLAWKENDFKYDFRLGIYAPTGDYDVNRLANIGKNFWTFEPSVSVSWLSSKIGLEVTAFAGLDFSTKNAATSYQSGDVLHLDTTIAEHLPLGNLGIFGVGANAFYYQQISNDSGNGAKLGGFQGRTVGLGPVISFIGKLDETDFVMEAKWLPEMDVDNRVKGNYVWIKLGVAF